ncbi:hypothetical protein BJ508DRAFT_419601 [Ascobolus immersus RN42]|uniref:Uncharacterized protein n=1 Tax=Ascobolus immersus RN42 TaxID=1160509 RepID=A0A3N4HHB0_ASCIM|nr:hypothetical protein BJ508DRAFT_419601 [Ascobolus immersus RN42]
MTHPMDEDDSKQRRIFNLRFRSCSRILTALPGKEIGLLQQHNRNINNVSVKRSVVRCHRIAFMLARTVQEEVSVMPLSKNGGLTLLVATSTPEATAMDIEADWSEGSNGSRKEDPGLKEARSTSGFLPLEWAEHKLSDEVSVHAYLATNWNNIPLQDHVGAFQCLAQEAQRHPETTSSYTSFIHYCLLVAYRKDMKTLLRNYPGGISYFKLLQNVGKVSFKKKRNSFFYCTPYEGPEDEICSYISEEELREVRAMRASAREAFSTEEDRTEFDAMPIFNLDLHSTRKLSRKATMRILENFYTVVLAALRRTAQVYACIPATPTIDDLIEAGNCLAKLHRFFYVLQLERSKLLPWIIRKWLEQWFDKEYGQMKTAAQKARTSIVCSDEDALEDEEIYGIEPLDSTRTVADRLCRYLRNSFATLQYAREIAIGGPMITQPFGIIRTTTGEIDSEDWQDTLRAAYKGYFYGESEPKCDQVISQVKSAAKEIELGFARPRPYLRTTSHCEVTLAALHLTARFNHTIPDPSLRHTLPILGFSKPVCPLCSLILEEINQLLEAKGCERIPILVSHTKPCSASLPPGLPDSAQKRIMKRVEMLVFETFEHFVRKQAREKKEMADRMYEMSSFKGRPGLDEQGKIYSVFDVDGGGIEWIY